MGKYSGLIRPFTRGSILPYQTAERTRGRGVRLLLFGDV